MSARFALSFTVAAVVVLAAAGPSLAQYDAQGRYVPSPNGVPTDPYARPVPGYSGTPGGAIGTPTLPRQPTVPPPVRLEAPRVQQVPLSTPSLPVPLTRAMCDEGWSVSTHIPRVEFNRRCKRMTKR